MSAEPLARTRLVVDGIDKVFPGRRRGDEPVHAVDDVAFAVEPGDAVGLVGASGSGKSTIARLVTGLERPDAGEIRFGEIRVDRLRGSGLRRLRKDVQLVFQDPYAALNPLHTVEYALSRPVANHLGLRGRAGRTRVLELLDRVGLAPVELFAAKLPHQLSGGQRQRVVIARALASEPQLLVADEPVSMLDVSLRAGVLRLLDSLRQETGLSLLYITHDLLSARLVTDRLLVLEHGRVVEHGPTKDVLQHPRHPYTQRLLDALPNPFAETAADGAEAASSNGRRHGAAAGMPVSRSRGRT